MRARIRTRRDLVRQGFVRLYTRLHQILLHHNPAGLDLRSGDARDDHRAAVGTLIPKLKTTHESDNARVLFEMRRAMAHEIWQAWTMFSASVQAALAGPLILCSSVPLIL